MSRNRFFIQDPEYRQSYIGKAMSSLANADAKDDGDKYKDKANKAKAIHNNIEEKEYRQQAASYYREAGETHQAEIQEREIACADDNEYQDHHKNSCCRIS